MSEKAVNSNDWVFIMKAYRVLFGRITVPAQNRNLQMTDVFSHPLGPSTAFLQKNVTTAEIWKFRHGY